MSEKRWFTVDDYIEERLIAPDPALAAALRNNRENGLPAIDVSATQGKLLHLLARMARAERVLEIGTLGGYSTIWLARAVPAGGRVVTLELDPHHAKVALENVARAGVSDRVDLRVGPALSSLRQLGTEAQPPFDFVFIDADKPSNRDYLEWAVKLARPGTVIVCDNVVRNGAVADATSTDASVRGSRDAFDFMRDHPRIDATAIQNVGAKGYDGLAIGLVT